MVDYNNKEEREKYLSELAENYEEGITWEEIKEPKRTITRAIVVHGEQADEFKKIRYNWGGIYYFKNGQSITQGLFQQGTKG